MNQICSNRTVPSLLATLGTLFAFALASKAARADGQLDPSFGSGGHLTLGIDSETGVAIHRCWPTTVDSRSHRISGVYSSPC